MKRYPHFLRKSKQTKCPLRIVGLDIDTDDVPSSLDRRTVYERLRAWSIHSETMHDGEPCGSYHKESMDVDEFWQGVEWTCKHGGNTMVVTYGACRAWGVLGLWDRAEQGKVVIGGEAERHEESRSGGACVPCVPLVADGPIADGTDEGVALPELLQRHGLGNVPHRRKGRRGGGPANGVVIVEDPPTIITLSIPGMPGRLTIVDLRNWGIRTYPHSAPLPRRSQHVLEVVLEMLSTIQAYDWGGLRMTAGAQAFHTYSFNYLTTPIHCHTVSDVLDMEQAGYYGGRCECRFIGKWKGHVVHLDYRNLYASVCAVQSLPVRLDSHGQGTPPSIHFDSFDPLQYMATVSIRSFAPDYPFHDGSLTVWPVGEFTTTLAGPELALAISNQHVKKWHCWARYDMEPALAGFASDVWNRLQFVRGTEKPEMEEWLKSMLVCLPGKLGQRGNTWEPYPGALPPAPWCYWWERGTDGMMRRCRALAWRAEREVVYPWAQESVPSMAAWITSYGRVELLKAIAAAGRNDCLYWDTDSVIVTPLGYHRLRAAGLVGNGELGMLREIDRGNDLEIRGVKDYTLNRHRRCSGEPHGTIYPAQLPGHYWYVDWLRRQIKHGHKPEAKRVLRRFDRSAEYRHGTVEDDGWVAAHVLTK